MGVDTGVIDKRGSFYSFGDVRLGQGRENVKQFLIDNAGNRCRDEDGSAVPSAQCIRRPTTRTARYRAMDDES